MDEKQIKAAAYLDKVNAKELSYTEARKALLKDGYTEEEIAVAVSSHGASKPKPYVYKSDAMPDEATVAIAKAKLGFVTENALREEQINAAAAGLIVPNKYAKGYFFNKFLKNHADAKTLEETGKLSPEVSGTLYERYRLIRYNTKLGIVGLLIVAIIAGPSLWQLIMQLFYSAGSNGAMTIFLSLGLLSWILAFTSPILFFFAKKESTLRAYIIWACILPGLMGIVLGFVVGNYLISAVSLFGILFALWQSHRVGILSVLGRK